MSDPANCSNSRQSGPVRQARVRVSTRFEVFKRDGFTCRYCGRKSPEVVLELDHILPRSKGGTDAPMNLATACWECNRGKGATLLSDAMTGEDPHDAAVEALERQRQLEEYNHVLSRVREYREKAVDDLCEYWDERVPNAHGMTVSTAEWLMAYGLVKYPPELIRQAMDVAISNTRTHDFRYVSGILRKWGSDG